MYRGVLGTLPNNTYVFGDFCTGEVFGIPTAGGARTTRLPVAGRLVSSFGEEGDGELLVVDYRGAVYRLVP